MARSTSPLPSSDSPLRLSGFFLGQAGDGYLSVRDAIGVLARRLPRRDDEPLGYPVDPAYLDAHRHPFPDADERARWGDD